MHNHVSVLEAGIGRRGTKIKVLPVTNIHLIATVYDKLCLSTNDGLLHQEDGILSPSQKAAFLKYPNWKSRPGMQIGSS